MYIHIYIYIYMYISLSIYIYIYIYTYICIYALVRGRDGPVRLAGLRHARADQHAEGGVARGADALLLSTIYMSYLYCYY